MSRSRTV